MVDFGTDSSFFLSQRGNLRLESLKLTYPGLRAGSLSSQLAQLPLAYCQRRLGLLVEISVHIQISIPQYMLQNKINWCSF